MARINIMRTWAGARRQGRDDLATLLFFMQISLVFWPAAVRLATRLERERQKQVLLNELALSNAVARTEPGLAPEFTSFTPAT